MSQWMIREDQLDPDQRDFINLESRKAGNLWIQGFAGSGKSVLLVHSLKRILQENPNASVVVVVFTHSLIEMFKAGIAELNLPKEVEVITYFELDKRINATREYTVRFDYILCDEVQDLPPRMLNMMRDWGTKVIVAGDANQSIYATDPQTGQPVVKMEEIEPILKAKPFSLNIIHRLTKSIINLVQGLLPTMNIWSAKRDLTKQDVNVRLVKADNLKQEAEYVYKEALKAANVGDSVALLFAHLYQISEFCNQILKNNGKPMWEVQKNAYGRLEFDSLNKHLRSHDIKIHYVANGYGDLQQAAKNGEIIVMSYHSSKGLDFDNVFLPMLGEGNLRFPDTISEEMLKTLFMVAMTRSKKNLYLSYIFQLNSLLTEASTQCTPIYANDVLTPKTTTTSPFDFDF
jgi:superfamily I DNA/RNA helicase